MSTTDPSAMQATIGVGFFHRIFGGKSWLHCLMELVKNTRDWGAMHTWILTEDRARLIVRDDGRGMNAANRDAFLSVNTTTAGKGQSGQFCTGTKQMLYSMARLVEVLTAPEDEPDWVYSFSFTTEDYERMALRGEKLRPKRLSKTTKTWPFEHLFGTQLIYILADTSSRRILRGARLAQELSARLPLKFKDILSVDGAALPIKEIVGQVFTFDEVNPQLGQVSMEIYRPTRRHAEEDLRLTGVEIGEAAIANLYRVLGDYRDQFPQVLLLPEVCGTLSVPFLSEYAMEDRTTIRAEVVDDPRIVTLLEILKRVSGQIQHSLEIRMAAEVGDDVERQIEDIRSICNAAYNPDQRPPGEGDLPGDDSAGGTGGKKQPPITLHCRREYEVGERIEVHATVRPNLGKVSDLRWYGANARAKDLEITHRGVAMMAAEVGTGTIRADLPGTIHSAVRAFAIVPNRVFRLSTPHATVPIGGSVTLFAVNADKLKGQLDWSLIGNGELEKDGSRVTYTAPRYPSTATLVGYDRSNPGIRATCEISVVGQMDTLCIRGVHFMVTTYNAPGDDARPVTMRSGGDPHQVIFNSGAPGFQAALKAGSQRELLLMALAQEFPAFHAFELEGVDLSELDPRDVPQLMRRLAREGFEIYEELIKAVA